MDKWKRTAPAARIFGAWTSKLDAVRTFAKSSPWLPLVGRAGLVIVGLLVLAWIGRVATATATTAQGSTTGLLGPPRATDSVAMSPSAAASATPLSLASVAPPLLAIATSAPIPVSASSSAAGRARASVEDPVYVNLASAEELRRLPGVGPKRAEAMVMLRQRMGRFQRVEDLLRVKGVGRTTLRKWRPLLRLDAPPATAVPADAGRTD